VTTLSELRERVEKASGPDRELDISIHEVLVGLRMYEDFYRKADDVCLRYYSDPTGPSYHRLPRYTASVDAALSLVERKAPITPYQAHCLDTSFTRDDGLAWTFRITTYSKEDETEEPTVCWATSFASAPLAILSALLKSLEAANG
jgi:hypothetical protein